MMKAKAWINILRPVNLIILALTLYFIDIFILQPNFTKYGLLFTLDEFHFFLLVLSTVLICGAGYIINDYFDVKTDAINKPHKQIVGKQISLTSAMRGYMLLTFTGLALGVYLSLHVGNWKLVTIHVIAVFLLYTYSASFKKVAILGNVIVALLTAISMLMIVAFEPHLYQLARPGDYYAAGVCMNMILAISILAFLFTMIREVIKDMEDVEGDKADGASTLPVRWGIRAAMIITGVIIAVTIAVLAWLFFQFQSENKNSYLIYFIVLISLLLGCFVLLVRAKTKQQFTLLSRYVKIAMLAGMCFMPLYFLIEF